MIGVDLFYELFIGGIRLVAEDESLGVFIVFIVHHAPVAGAGGVGIQKELRGDAVLHVVEHAHGDIGAEAQRAHHVHIADERLHELRALFGAVFVYKGLFFVAGDGIGIEIVFACEELAHKVIAHLRAGKEQVGFYAIPTVFGKIGAGDVAAEAARYQMNCIVTRYLFDRLDIGVQIVGNVAGIEAGVVFVAEGVHAAHTLRQLIFVPGKAGVAAVGDLAVFVEAVRGVTLGDGGFHRVYKGIPVVRDHREAQKIGVVFDHARNVFGIFGDRGLALGGDDAGAADNVHDGRFAVVFCRYGRIARFHDKADVLGGEERLFAVNMVVVRAVVPVAEARGVAPRMAVHLHVVFASVGVIDGAVCRFIHIGLAGDPFPAVLVRFVGGAEPVLRLLPAGNKVLHRFVFCFGSDRCKVPALQLTVGLGLCPGHRCVEPGVGMPAPADRRRALRRESDRNGRNEDQHREHQGYDFSGLHG